MRPTGPAGLPLPLRQLSTTSVFSPSKDSLERPTPVILIPGEGLGPEVFRLWVDSLQNRGYGGVVMTTLGDDPEALGDAIHEVVESEQMVPPVLITHSMGSHAAINYLESHSLAGLVLLNPLPVHPSQSASMLLSRHADCVATAYQTETEDSAEGILSRYYGVRPPGVIPSHCHDPCGYPTALARGLSRHAGVKLEPGAVPCLVVLSGGDDAIYDHQQEQDLLNMWRVCEDTTSTVTASPALSAAPDAHEAVSPFEGHEGATEGSPHLLRLPYDLSRYSPGNSTARERAIWWMDMFT
jgi:pimeloyl-ACP methyl ester carboxylesterase